MSQLKYFTDLILGKGFCIFIFFHFPDSSPSVLNGLYLYFSLRDSASRECILTTFTVYQVQLKFLRRVTYDAFAES